MEPFRADLARVTGLTQRRHADPSNRPFMRINLGGRTRSLFGMSVSFRNRASRGGVHLETWLTRHQLSSRDTPVDTVAPTTAPTQTCVAV